ncbi:MAG: neutral/alkaline non-lysosomal ceramidase N-terminal domain-containing protein [Acidobacteria bacterium]|nr:neutral/alkaline non-lysosomal ceramidase N-terminal domain-containing protein [Acidobacteriota bacterium]
MTTIRISLALLVMATLPTPLHAASGSWKAGVAKVRITPEKAMGMAGYAARKHASEGTLEDIYVKALALEDQSGRRAVLVTSDLLGFPADSARRVADRAQKDYHLPRDRLVLNSSHTHAGPVLSRTLSVAYDMNDADWAAVESYTRELDDKVVSVIGAALKDLKPAQLSFGHSEAGFAMNRRAKTEKGVVMTPNTAGPVDHDVPILRVEGKKGALRGIVFGYACHNTTLGGDFYQFNGDYAGFAQEWLERRHPDALALFVAGCGADANPNPRGTPELARQHGEELGTAVDKALAEKLAPIRGPLKSAWDQFPVAFAPSPGREEWEKRLQDPNIYIQRHARMMLDILNRDGRLPAEYPYPLQVWRFDNDLTFIAMAGEVVVDYDLRLKKELGADRLWVAGYSNDVFAYIPSVRILQEGGYEGGGAMIYYGQPGPFAPSVEEMIIGKIHELVKRAGSR